MSGAETPVLSAPLDTTSIKTESAVKSRVLASSSTNRKEFAKNVTKDTQSSTDAAKESMSLKPTTSDAPSGLMVSVLSAPRDGSSMLMVFAPPSVITAPLGTKPQVLALPATTDLSLSKETVSLMLIPVLFPRATSSAKSGIRKTVLSAQPEVSSMLMDFVSLLAHNATLSIRLQETA